MRAVVYDRYGPPEVLRLEDVERPVPKDDELLIRDPRHAPSTARTAGWRGADPFFIARLHSALRAAEAAGFSACELAGEVEAVGPAVSEFAVGDRVFGDQLLRRPRGVRLRCARAPRSAHMPAGMTFEEAAAVCDGARLIALSCLKPAHPLAGRSILVYGASGSIGTAAVQLARHFGADVTAVCNTKSVELVRSLGADEVIDYTQEDFTRNGKTYDVIFDAVGKHSFRRCRGSLKPGGLYIETDLGFMWHVPALALLTRWVGDKRATLGIARYRKEDVVFLKELIEAGEYRAVIDRTLPAGGRGRGVPSTSRRGRRRGTSS